MSNLRRLFRFLRPYRGAIALGVLCLLLATPLTLFHPLVWKFIVDTVIPERSVRLLIEAVAVMYGVHLAGTALSVARTILLERACERFVFDLRSHVFAALMRQSLSYFHQRRAGDLLARAMGDVDAVRDIVINGIDLLISNFLGFICVAGIIIWLQPVVGLITLIPLAVVFVAILVFNDRVKALYARIRARLGDVSAKLHESIAGAQVIKAFAREGHEVERFRADAGGYLKESLRGVLVRAIYFPSIMSFGFLSNVAMVGLGGWFVMQGQMKVGDLVAYRGYWWQLFSPVMSLAQINDLVARANAAAARIIEVLDAQPEIPDAPDAVRLDRLRGEIAFADVGFAYANGSRALEHVAFSVQGGESVGVVGPSGAGKSTLLGLLLRFHDPSSGRILVDGTDLRSVAQDSLRSQCGVVTQEAFLFHGTVRENIRYGSLDADDARIEAAARSANAHDFITALPKGYDTPVGERGVTLSGGQRQRICIARAFLAEPALLLLDEPTAAVEPESEAAIQAALARLMAGRTSLIISHRLSMVRDCTRILVIERGRVTEQGTHAELMTLEGWYARMYRLQMGEEKLAG